MGSREGGNSTDGALNGVKSPRRSRRVHNHPRLKDLDRICKQPFDHGQFPLATDVQSKIPIYDLQALAGSSSPETMQDEWYHVLLDGPGLLVIKHFEGDTNLIRSVNDSLDKIVASETNDKVMHSHFLTAKGNDTWIWNSFQKHAIRDPSSFVKYYSNPWLALICQAWLGPSYQLTAQHNILRTGGKPQTAHRDYHLGFQTPEIRARFPRSMHIASQLLTLQGAVAHSNITLQSGPTRFLPCSQLFEDGFLAYQWPEFQDYFDEHFVHLPLGVGDAMFFNPALFHAAGCNEGTTDRRLALFQVSSAFGRTMDSVNTMAIIDACWNEMRRLYEKEGSDSPRMRAITTAVAEGNPFPANLDKRHPAPGGMAPQSEVDIVEQALAEGWDREKLMAGLLRLKEDSKP